jgi:hypothetical protein
MSNIDKLATEYYKSKVEHLADTRSSEIIGNNNFEHAKILIENLFKIAKNKIKIFTGKGSQIFNDEIIKILEKKKTDGVKISIKCENDLVDYDALNSAGIKVEKTISSNPFKNHFVTVDESAYRFEEEHEENATTVKAQACFGDTEGNAKFLDNLFRDILVQQNISIQQN